MTWRFSQRAWIVRWYVWFYRADPRRASLCSLAWGILLSPIFLPFRLMGIALAPWLNWLLQRSDRWMIEHEPKEHPRLEKVVGWVDRHATAWRYIGFAFLPLAAYDAYLNLLWLLYWIPYFVFFGALAVAPTTTGRFIREAYHGVKDRTCPRIDITE